MRVEATIPETRGAAVTELAAELGLTRSQVVDEALALFLKAVVEVRKGRRLVMVDPSRSDAVCELATPTLSALEWTLSRQKLNVSVDELTGMAELIADPPKAGARLRAAARRQRR